MQSLSRFANVSEARAMRTAYASDAQERERSEPRLASDTSYNGACSHEVERSEDQVMRRPYASDAQERERSEPRLASHTSYNAVALIHASISEAWVIGNCLMELPLRLRARAKQKQREFLMLAAPVSRSKTHCERQVLCRYGACPRETERQRRLSDGKA